MSPAQMKWYRPSLLLIVLFGAALLASLMPPVKIAGAAVAWYGRAMWELDEPSGCTTALDRVEKPVGIYNHGAIASTGVALNGAGTCANPTYGSGRYKFTGWENVVSGGAIPDAATVPANASEVVVTQNDNKLDPWSSSFKIVLRFTPTLVWRDPDGPGGEPAGDGLPNILGNHSDVSYNMVMKGRSNDPGGSYKGEMLGDHGGDTGKIRCVFRDDDGQSVSVKAGQVTLATASLNKVECGIDRERGVAFIRVLENGEAGMPAGGWGEVIKSLPAGFDDIHPNTDTSFGNRFNIGKKSGSTDPRDAFAGKIYYVRLYFGN